MKQKKLLVVALVIAAFIVAFLLIRGRNQNQARPKVVAPLAALVSITEDGFAPENITIKAGTVVVWRNNDSSLHRVAADPFPTHASNPELDSKSNIEQNGTYRFTFSKTGTYKYHDELHPEHGGTVTVQ